MPERFRRRCQHLAHRGLPRPSRLHVIQRSSPLPCLREAVDPVGQPWYTELVLVFLRRAPERGYLKEIFVGEFAAVPVEVLVGVVRTPPLARKAAVGCVMHAKNANAGLCAGVAYLPDIGEKQCAKTIHILRAVDEPR